MIITGRSLTEAVQVSQLQCTKTKEDKLFLPVGNLHKSKLPKKNIEQLEIGTKKSLAIDIQNLEALLSTLKVFKYIDTKYMIIH